jgi:P27 family predicted phage terminase small subunit
MPTPIESADQMTIGASSGGKHWTQAEVESRQAAAEGLKRKRVRLEVPDWLDEDAKKVWASIRRKLWGIQLLDNLDTEMLAIYCDAVVHYHKASKLLHDPKHVTAEEEVKSAQAWARIVSAYAEKLGLSPNARARLAKKKAEKMLDEFGDTFG